MNDVVVPWCRTQKIEVSRSRAYKKNDQAFVEQKNGAVVRRLVGYGRFDGVETKRVLERLYAASRLHTNFFQPSFKLKDKRREGAKVIKRYHVPATPYARALAHPKLSKGLKRRLRELYRTLDPVALLAEMRAAQTELGTRVGARAGKLAAPASPPAAATNAAAFAKGLGNDVHLGEQRIIHRRIRKPYKNAHENAFDARSTPRRHRALARGRTSSDRAGHTRSSRRAFPRKVRAAAAHHRAALVAITQTQRSQGDHPAYSTGHYW
ncbi:hypothetical protein IVA94_38655 [Bradyrhizobium sp. 156]|uniref:hypothetical protein n=1 Tax=Bradyrhizobium sp. 156 TaxID=2782630 RepID=UPI001FF9D8AC|nr:hypothetical protein [Bradyrhizobium sp. 156]MCK1326597.1 hypothetical protein [Bradyrhizobium sp. 156]